MVKVRRCISIDQEVWDLAKSKISEPVSCFIQKQLEIACNLSNDKMEIEKQLYEKEQEITALRSQLIKIEAEEQLKKDIGYDFEKCIPTINRIYEVHNVIGENQIGNVAMANDIQPGDLVNYCRLKGYNIVPLFEFEKITRKYNGGGLR